LAVAGKAGGAEVQVVESCISRITYYCIGFASFGILPLWNWPLQKHFFDILPLYYL